MRIGFIGLGAMAYGKPSDQTECYYNGLELHSE